MKKNRIMMAVLAAALASGCSGGAAPAAVSETEETAAVQEEETLQLMERPSLLDGSFAKNTGTEASAEEYTVEPGLTNVLNYSDVEYLTEGAKKQIEEQYFTVRDGWSDEFFEIYESNTYGYTPSFVTVDSMMHTFHLYYAFLQKNTEQTYLFDALSAMSKKMLEASQNQYEALKGSEWESAAQRNVDYFSVALSLLGEDVSLSGDAQKEIDSIMGAADISPSVLFTTDEADPYLQDYTQFKPRGYYTENEKLEKYFRAMMWFGQMNFTQKYEDLDRSALLMNLALEESAVKEWESIYTITAFFSGESDDCGYYEYNPAVHSAYGSTVTADTLKGNTPAFEKYRKLTSGMKPPKINSIVVYDETIDPDRDAKTLGWRLMGQRFTLDASIFQNLTYREVGENASGERRMLPDALDVCAAMGNDEALSILKEKGVFEFKDYEKNMNTLRESLAKADDKTWNASIYSAWLYTLKPLLEEKPDGYPAFTKSAAWTRKNLVGYLGSYTELKHDSILYAKQVMAEMGGAGFDEIPDDRGYVETEPEVFARLSSIAKATADGLESYQMISDTDKEYMYAFADLASKLQVIAEKELRGELPTDEEFDLIRSYGGQLEHLWTRTVDDGTQEYYRAMDHPSPIVADVATDPNGTCLELGTGKPSTIYVAVYFDGEVRVCLGSVYSFYQFEQPISDRMTDEEWREKVNDWNNPPAKPDWTSPLYAD